LPAANELSTAVETVELDSVGSVTPKEPNSPWLLPVTTRPAVVAGERVSARDTAEQKEMAATAAMATTVLMAMELVAMERIMT
jgi:hypothetical protein